MWTRKRRFRDTKVLAVVTPGGQSRDEFAIPRDSEAESESGACVPILAGAARGCVGESVGEALRRQRRQ